ncbi:MAG TPA: FAD-binding oxidoreductase [Paracoccaceae bacterium]|nr:FAD-binding oxidoreductase [Paracoccaceae bacterium]
MTGVSANDSGQPHPQSWYLETAGEIPEYPRLKGDHQADICIIGGGYAGLSAALRLAEAGRRVILLEAHRIGWGASGRNGGQLGVGPRVDIRKYEALIGEGDARKVWDISLAANRLVRDLIAVHRIDCDLRDGHLEAAWRKSDLPAMADHAEHIAAKYGHPGIELLDDAGIAALIGTGRYFGGAIDRLAGHLHPLRFAIGFGRAAAGQGAILCEQSRAISIEPGLVKTPEGRVRAPEILLACNGYLGGLAPPASRRMLPLNNFIIATEPLDSERALLINREDLAVSDTRFVLNYFRLTPDRRLLWGGGEGVGRNFPADIKSLVRRRMLEIYPDLADLEITHAWGGTLAITVTRFPMFRDLGRGIRAIGGWSGSGIHMATMGGRVAADAIMGAPGEWDLLARLPTPSFPGGDRLRMPLLRLALFWYGLRDRL